MAGPSLQTSFVDFTILGLIQSKNEVAPLEVRNRLKTDGVKNFADQDRKATILYLIFAAQASNFYDFYNVLDILSPKIKMLSQR